MSELPRRVLSLMSSSLELIALFALSFVSDNCIHLHIILYLFIVSSRSIRFVSFRFASLSSSLETYSLLSPSSFL